MSAKKAKTPLTAGNSPAKRNAEQRNRRNQQAAALYAAASQPSGSNATSSPQDFLLWSSQPLQRYTQANMPQALVVNTLLQPVVVNSNNHAQPLAPVPSDVDVDAEPEASLVKVPESDSEHRNFEKELCNRYMPKSFRHYFCPNKRCPNGEVVLPIHGGKARCEPCKLVFDEQSKHGVVHTNSIIDFIIRLLEDTVLGEIIIDNIFDDNGNDKQINNPKRGEHYKTLVADRDFDSCCLPIVFTLASDDTKANGNNQTFWSCNLTLDELPDNIKPAVGILIAQSFYQHTTHSKPSLTVALHKVCEELRL